MSEFMKRNTDSEIGSKDENLLRKAVPFTFDVEIVKKAEEMEDGEPKWIIEGWASTSAFDGLDIITDEALQESERDLIGKTLLANHDMDRPIGKILETVWKEDGLWIKALVSQTEPLIWKKIQEGVLSAFSIRGRVLKATKRWVAKYNQVVNFVQQMKLVEASLVSVPQNDGARVITAYLEKAFKDAEEGGDDMSAQGNGMNEAFVEQLAGSIKSAVSEALKAVKADHSGKPYPKYPNKKKSEDSLTKEDFASKSNEIIAQLEKAEMSDEARELVSKLLSLSTALFKSDEEPAPATSAAGGKPAEDAAAAAGKGGEGEEGDGGKGGEGSDGGGGAKVGDGGGGDGEGDGEGEIDPAVAKAIANAVTQSLVEFKKTVFPRQGLTDDPDLEKGSQSNGAFKGAFGINWTERSGN